jgi:hypothetical protein
VNNTGFDFRIPWRCHQAIWAARHGLNIEGDFVELGTGKGFIMQAVLGSIEDWNLCGKRLLLYDVFQKHERSGLGQRRHNKYYAESLESVQHSFQQWKNVVFVQGDVRESIIATRAEKISFLHVDLNDADTETDLLRQLWPSVSTGAVVIVDDYANRGEEWAYARHNELFRELGVDVLTTPSGQGLVVKPPASE